MLSERQSKLLEAIINEYIEKAEPVGSVEIVSKYNLKCSPATIRNEMSKLIDLGFLEMLHTSSGRIPTKMAYRLYLDQMMSEEELPVLQEVALKQRLWTNRYEFEKLLRETVLSLAENTKYLAIATTDEGFMTSAGAVNVLENKEFWDIDVAKSALFLLDNYEVLLRIFENSPYGGDIKCVIEEEIGLENLNRSALIFTQYKAGNKSGYICLLGPSRMDYARAIPILKYSRRLLEELGGSW